MFKKLTPEEEVEFRKWARENYTPMTEIKGIWHPVVQAECVKMNAEAGPVVEQELKDEVKRLLGRDIDETKEN